MSKSVRIEKAILGYPHLFEKHASAPGATPKYSADFVLDPIKNQESVDALERAFKEVVTEAGKADNLQYLQSPLLDGTELNMKALAKGNKPRAELEGMKVIRAKDATYAPAVVNARLQPIPESQRDQIFGGCIVNAFVDLYWSSNPVNPGVYCGLRGVQLVDNVNVTPLGGGALSAEQMFEEVKGAPEQLAPAEEKGPSQDAPSWM